MGYIKDKYDVTLTQSIWDDCIDDQSDIYYTYDLNTICITGFTDTSSRCEEEEDYVNYHNFQAITNVSFNREVHNGTGAPEVFSCMSGTSMMNVELSGQTVAVMGDGVPITGLTFTDGGFVVITEEDTAVNGIQAHRDFDGTSTGSRSTRFPAARHRYPGPRSAETWDSWTFTPAAS